MVRILSIIRRVINSISFLTFCIAFAFGLLAVLLVAFNPDFLDDYPSLAISDVESIKFILSFTIGGIFTLTIFSYTMVMDVLNRSISNYSPRLIPLILREKHHQIILGVTSGTIVYCLVMAAFISSDNHDKFPSLAAPLAILMGIISILLFIYFIHSVSQTIHVNYVLRKSFFNTKNRIQHLIDLPFEKINESRPESFWKEHICFPQCGYLNSIRTKKLISLSEEHGIELKLLKTMGNFVLEGEPVLAVSKEVKDTIRKELMRCISIDRAEAIEVIEVGYKHLVEVGVKASSPAVNDPGTALMSIDYLTQLFIHRKNIQEFTGMKSVKGGILFFSLVPIEKLMELCFAEMEHFMGEDPILQRKLAWSKKVVSV